MYQISTEARADAHHTFTQHPTTPDQIDRYAKLRRLGEEMELAIRECVPQGYRRIEALKCNEMTIMWANKGIACGETPKEKP